MFSNPRYCLALLVFVNYVTIRESTSSSLNDRVKNFKSSDNQTVSPEEIAYALDPYMSMEDVASKEKIIVNSTAFLPPPFILGPVSSEENSPTTAEEMDSDEEDDSVSSEGEDFVPPSPSSEPPPPLLVETNVSVNSAETMTMTTPQLTTTTTSSPPTTTPTTTLRPKPAILVLPSPSPPSGVDQEGDKMTYRHPLPVVKYNMGEDIDEKLFLILQNAVRETYFSFRDILGMKYRTQISSIEDELRGKINQLDIDLNVKIVTLDTTTHSRIQTLTDQIIDQRKEDIQTFSDNLHQIQKTHQMHMDSQKMEIQQLQVTMELLNKGQSSLSTKMSQLQKTVNNLDSKVAEMVIKNSEDLATLKDSQKILHDVADELQLNLKTNDAEFKQVQDIVKNLQKAAAEDHGKLRRTLIREQVQDPIQSAIRQLRNKNVGTAIKHWRTVESITEDLKETLPSVMTRIIDESYGKGAINLATILDFVHKAVAGGDRRLKETAYSSIMRHIDSSKELTDQKKTIEVFNLAQTMKSDLGIYYNSSAITAEIVTKLPDMIKLITFDKVKLLLAQRGYLRVAADRKVTLVSQEGRFYDSDEILWQFEYDKEKSDGTFYIKSDKLQKYLVTLHEGFNSYGFSKQGLFVTGNKKENGTRFQMTIVNQGEYVLFKSVFHNGYLTWKSNIQTIYGDDDSYFLLLVERKNGPSPYWKIEPQ